MTEMLFAIGAGKEVIGVSSFDTYPPAVKSLPKVGALIDPDFERILSLKPDLVAVFSSQTDLITRLSRARVPVFRYEHAGLADITATIRALGDRVGRVESAGTLASRIEREIDEVRKSTSTRRRPRTVVIFEREPGALRNIYANAGVGFVHDMLEAAGGEDIFADVKKQNVQATAEMLLARAPEVIVEIHAGATWTRDQIARERDVWRGLPALPAVKAGRIHIVTDERLVVPGPRVAEAVRLLANLLHGADRK